MPYREDGTCRLADTQQGTRGCRWFGLPVLTHSRTRGPAACSLGRLTSGALQCSVCDRRQGELKGGAAGQVRACPQPAAVRFDDRTADRQAHPQAAGFCRVESLEDAIETFWINAARLVGIIGSLAGA